MKKYVEKYKLGVVANDFNPESLADQLNGLTNEQILNFKKNSHKYSWELSAEKNLKYYSDLVLNNGNE